MRIHFFVRTLNDKTGGGSHYNSIAYMRALREAGHIVVVHVLYEGSGNSFPHDIQPIVHQGLRRSFLNERRYLSNLLKEYEDESDIFFLYAVEFTWGGGLYRRTGGKKPVVVYMDAYLASMRVTNAPTWKMKWYQWKRLPWDKIVGCVDAAFIDQFLPCSPYIGAFYQQFGFPKDRFTLVPNIVPPPFVPASSEKGIQNEICVIYVGRLIYDKGIDLLIDALQSLREFSWKLSIVGDGDMRDFVERRIREQNLPITLHGWVPQKEVGRFYAEADIFVHPARWPDPAPRTIVDALYCGLPVIVPDTGGSSWIAGEAGLVFKTGDLVTLTEKMRTVLANTDARRALTAHSNAQTKKFEQATVGAHLENILQTTIENARV